MKKKLCVLFALLFWVTPVFAREVIEDFNSQIQVQTDGSMIVTETLTVHHEGIKIRRGIYRDLPTTKREKYELVGVKRNGHYEPSFVEKRRGYYRINTGNDSFLPQPATSVFEITYRVWNVPKSYEGYDEVYWNVTGDEWAFPIENVSAQIILPAGAEIIQQASYIGRKGSTESATYEGEGNYTGRYLSPGEQLTIAVGFTPGIVSTEKRIFWPDYTKEDLLPFILYVIYVLLLIFIWTIKGRDPTGRAIMPQYEPPKELTAAQAACLYHKGRGVNLAAISFLQMVSNGFLKLTTNEKNYTIFSVKSYTLEKTGRAPENAEEECFVHNKIILDGNYSYTIDRLVEKVSSKIEKSMKLFYTQNRSWVLLPTMLCFGIMGYMWAKKVPMFNVNSDNEFLLYTILATIVISSTFCNFTHRSLLGHLISSAISIGILDFFVVYHMAGDTSLLGLVLLPLVLFTSSLFCFLIYQPTEQGQRLTEYLEGLKMFLEATQMPARQKAEIKSKLTEKTMEKLFPYALALGMEEEWEKQFAYLFGAATYRRFETTHTCMNHAFYTTFSSKLSSSSHSSGGGSGSGGGGSSGGGSGGGGGGGR